MKMLKKDSINKLSKEEKKDLKKKIRQVKKKGIVQKNITENDVNDMLRRILTIYVNHIDYKNYSPSEIVNFVYPNLLKLHICKFSEDINNFDFEELISYTYNLFNDLFENKKVNAIEYELHLIDVMRVQEGVSPVNNYEFKRKIKTLENVLYKIDVEKLYDVEYNDDSKENVIESVGKKFEKLNKCCHVDEEKINTIVRYLFKMFYNSYIEELLENGHDEFVSNILINTLKVAVILYFFEIIGMEIVGATKFMKKCIYKKDYEMEISSKMILESNNLKTLKIDSDTLEIIVNN